MALPVFEADKYRFPSQGSDIANQCGNTLDLILGAEKNGIIDSPAKSLDDFSDESPDQDPSNLEQLNVVRIGVIAEQLWLLGYLKNKPKKDVSPKVQNNKYFKKALIRFQKEAGLIQDSWTGEQTWKALQELVSFETPISPQSWRQHNGDFQLAFKRGMYLRLRAYGLIAASKHFKKVDTSEDGGNIGRLIRKLKPEAHSGTSWIEALLDPDQMVQMALNALQKPEQITKRQTSLARRLVTNVAKVELWLLGSDIKVDGRDDVPVNSLGKHRETKDTKVIAELHRYWEETLGYLPEEAEQKAASLNPEFFQSILEPEKFSQADASEFSEEDFSKRSAEYFESQADPDSAIDIAHTEYKSLGMKLWDGLKRLWRWIKRGIKKIVDFSKNLIRGFFRFASKGFTIVKTAFMALADSLKDYTRGYIGDLDNAMVIIKKDMDFISYTPEPLSSKQTHNVSSAVKLFSSKFVFSCRLVSAFIDILKSIASGVIGWARFLLALVKNYRVLVPAYRELRALMPPK